MKARIVTCGFALALLLAVAVPIFPAGRTEEDDFIQVEGTGNWEYTIDVTDREPGKYNILVRARDGAGNVALGGPYNVFIDPASDLPRTAISYPVAGEAVGERLLVVGSAQDDDAVEYVEVQIADGAWVRAEGQDYWSAFVPVRGLPDGPHTIRARAVDINGTEGEPVEIPVRLDTTRPVLVPTSHESGVLISRRTTVEGTVEDANGIASLTLVDGERRESIRLRGRGDGPRTFSFRIDPREMDEGAAVWWLESVDGTGAVGMTPFLFFVDTSPPEIELLYPTEEDRVDAQLRLVGRVADQVGIASLTYDVAGQVGEIPLTPGDPYWSLAIDLPPDTRGRVRAEFTVTDLAGNERTERLRYELDTEGDLPVVSLVEPPADGVVDRPYLAGHIADDDGGAAIVYSIDRGAEERIDLREGAGDGFLVELPELGSGTYEVRMRAVDRYGTEGPEVRRSFSVARAPSPIRIEEVVTDGRGADYEPGFAVASRASVSIRGTLVRDERVRGVERVAWTIGAASGEARTDESGRFEIRLPRSSDGGVVPMELVTESALGIAGRTVGFYVQLPKPANDGSTPEITDYLDRGLYAVSEQRGASDAPLLLAPGDSLRFRSVGGAPIGPSISPEVDFLSVRVAGDTVVLEATGAGAVDNLVVSASVGGSNASTAPLTLRTELEGPTIDLPEGLVGRRFSGFDEIRLGVSDSSGVAAVTVAVQAADSVDRDAGPGDTRATASEAATAGESGFVVTPRLPGADGPAVLRIAATDESGLSSSLVIPIIVDTSAPELRPITPAEGDTVNGTITVHAILSEPGSTTAAAAVTEGTDGTEGTSTPVPVDRLIVHEITASEVGGALSVRLADSAGNEAVRRVPVSADPTADLPRLQLQVPREGGLVQQEFTLSGVVVDDDAPASVTYAINDRAAVTTRTDGIFNIAVPMEGLDDGDHSITMFATDIGGVESEPIVRSFVISRSVPETDVTEPALDAYLRGVVTVSGTSADPNGIAEVFVSTDNGASYQRAAGTESWTYRLDTSLLDDGTHSVLVRAVDGAGEASLLSTTINVDNTDPVLELAEPLDGVTVSGEFLIDGRGEDGSLARVRLVAQALGSSPPDRTEETEEGTATAAAQAVAAEPPIELVAFDEPGPFAYAVDTSTLAPGWYNLRVEAEDRAGNLSRISRNLLVESAEATQAPQVLVPADGARLAHRFAVTVASNPAAGPVTLLANGAPIGVVSVDTNGVGSTVIEPGTVRAGTVELTLRTEAQGELPALSSAARTVEYASEGAWVAVDAPGFLGFVRDRPFVTGRAGYELVAPEPDPEASERDNARAARALLAAHAVELVEVSLDNGRSYEPARGTDDWQYRLETTELTDGRHNLVVRARFANGETAVTRHSLVVDERAPQVRLLAPNERDTFDESVRIVGVTTDEHPLADVSVVLRQGDKSRYELPSFIEGLYIDLHALGATYWDVGAGLTFFDNNVRLQAQIGQAPPGTRFNGLVVGTKLLANVASLPASFLLGPDYGWLSGALAVGANFSYFTMSDDTIAITEEGLVLAGMVAQLEFPIVTLEDLAMFNTYSLYTEAQLWFISSDVEAGTAFRLAFGLRANVF